tara:strand:+ start:701 stop:1933 length:1233 start_codon:yes stop_codon:yes gene_type:complete
MVFAVGCVHPKGEDSEYDGLYFRQDEMAALATGLCGLPVCVEHLADKPVGKVVHAWVNPEDNRLFAMLETDDNNYPSILAGRLLMHGLTGELSLGHNVVIDHVEGKVVEKTPTEVSIVAKGAREHTGIYTVDTQKGKQRYIKTSVSSQVATPVSARIMAPKNTNSQDENMSEAPKDSVNAGAAPQDSQTMMTQLLEQVKALTEKNTKMEESTKANAEKYASFEEQMKKEKEIGQKKREQAIDGSIKDMFQQLFEKYQSELSPYQDDLTNMMAGMKENAHSTPMVEALACAAAMSSASTVELEAAYQENKKLKAELDSNKKELASAMNPYFSSKRQRLETLEAKASIDSGESSTSAQAPIQSIFRTHRVTTVPAGRGMKELNPGMWTDLLASTKRGTGMPTVEDFLKIGKD